jgi:hypothetical protein
MISIIYSGEKVKWLPFGCHKFTPAQQARSARLHTTRQRRLILLASLAGVSLEEARRGMACPKIGMRTGRVESVRWLRRGC